MFPTERVSRMAVSLKSVVPGGIRAVTYRNGVRRSVIYPGMDAVAYEQASPPTGESSVVSPEPEAGEEWGPFAGWYRLPRVGMAAVYGAVATEDMPVPA